jgi:hypothetical protein
MMPANDFDSAAEEAVGMVQDVDVAGRTLTILVEGTPRTFDLAPDCAIVLHGERVKLRLVQPRDQAHVVYHRTPDGLLAFAVELRWWFPTSVEGRLPSAGRAPRPGPRVDAAPGSRSG